MLGPFFLAASPPISRTLFFRVKNFDGKKKLTPSKCKLFTINFHLESRHSKRHWRCIFEFHLKSSANMIHAIWRLDNNPNSFLKFFSLDDFIINDRPCYSRQAGPVTNEHYSGSSHGLHRICVDVIHIVMCVTHKSHHHDYTSCLCR